MKLLVIGSSANSNIVINSQYVSSYHAELLLLDNGDILLEDKGSRNGTYLNEAKLQPNKEVNVKRGDNVRFANVPLDWNAVPVVQRPDMKTVKEMRGIGTNFRNRYQLHDGKVSRFHATLKKTADGKWLIQDHSTNGTTVNGVKIQRDQDVCLKRGDRILCAGVPVANPCDEERGAGIAWPKVARIAALAAAIIVACIVIKALMTHMSSGSGTEGGSGSLEVRAGHKMTDSELFDHYKTATVLMYGEYYFEASAGNLDLSDVNLPTKFIISDGKLVDVSQNGGSIPYTGTGFFVSPDGRLITNLHIVKPWLFGNDIEEAREFYKRKLQVIANQLAPIMPELPLGAYVSEVKVEGRLRYLALVPHGSFFDGENFVKCKVVTAGDDVNVDVALVRTVKAGLPSGCTYVRPDDIVDNDDAIRVGNHIYTIGFPKPGALQDLKDSPITAYARPGNITRECNDYNFGFDAASLGGASGSPVFNEYGQVVGILNQAVVATTDFNFAIKASHAKKLLDK